MNLRDGTLDQLAAAAGDLDKLDMQLAVIEGETRSIGMVTGIVGRLK